MSQERNLYIASYKAAFIFCRVGVTVSGNSCKWFLMAHENDASYKLLFSVPELVRDLVMGFIPDAWLHSLDYSTL